MTLDTEHGWFLFGRTTRRDRQTHNTRGLRGFVSPTSASSTPVRESQALAPNSPTATVGVQLHPQRFYSQQGLAIGASTRAAAVGPDWWNRPSKQGHGSSGLARSSSHKGSCVFRVTENMSATAPPSPLTPNPRISTSPPAALVDTAAFPMTPKAN